MLLMEGVGEILGWLAEEDAHKHKTHMRNNHHQEATAEAATEG